jgi:hypothetical protein
MEQYAWWHINTTCSCCVLRVTLVQPTCFDSNVNLRDNQTWVCPDHLVYNPASAPINPPSDAACCIDKVKHRVHIAQYVPPCCKMRGVSSCTLLCLGVMMPLLYSHNLHTPSLQVLRIRSRRACLGLCSSVLKLKTHLTLYSVGCTAGRDSVTVPGASVIPCSRLRQPITCCQQPNTTCSQPHTV